MIVLCFDPGKVNLSMCLVSYELGDGETPSPLQILHWENINLDQEAPTPQAKRTLAEYVELMTQSLERRDHLFAEHHIDTVAIEQQPAGGSNKFSSVNIKVLSHVIQTYYMMRHPDTTTLFVAPSIKLANYKKQLKAREAEEAKSVEGGSVDGAEETKSEEVVEETKKRSRAYSNNKKLSVAHAREVLVEHGLTESLAVLNGAGSKKDDLCDAFLLAYHHIRRALKPVRTRKKKS